MPFLVIYTSETFNPPLVKLSMLHSSQDSRRRRYLNVLIFNEVHVCKNILFFKMGVPVDNPQVNNWRPGEGIKKSEVLKKCVK